MKWLTHWFIHHKIAANLLMFLVMAAGILSLNTIRVESFPQIPTSQLKISVVYPGASPEQVDEGVTQRIENAISGIAGIGKIASQSSRGFALIQVKKTTGTDLTVLMDDIRNAVNGIVGLPLRAEQPQLTRDEYTNLAAYVMLYGDADTQAMQQAAIKVNQALRRHPLISQVTDLGKLEQELVVEPDRDTLRKYKLTLGQLAEQMQSWSLEYRSGLLKTAQGNIVLRGDNNADTLLKLAAIPVIVTDNSQVLLGDIAQIKRGYEEVDGIVRYQGKPAVSLMVSTSKKDNLLDVSDAIHQVVQELKTQLPQNIKLDVMADMSPYIKEQLSLLGTNAWQGILIVLVLLGLFLNIRIAFWVALGIPISLAGTLWLMGPLGYTINDITLFGFILVLGVLVDDAVVVAESIYESQQNMADPKLAAEEGVNKVATATVFGVLTTIAAFSPMLWIENELARMLAGFSAVVILALIFSLIESKFILPHHLANMKQTDDTGPVAKLRRYCLSYLDTFYANYYQPVLSSALNNKFASLVIFSSVMLSAYGFMATGAIKSAFFPDIPSRFLSADIIMRQDAPLSLTLENVKKVEQGLIETEKTLMSQYQLDESPIIRRLVSTEGSHRIELVAELSYSALSLLPAQEVLSAWRKAVGSLEGAYAQRYKATDDVAGSTALTITAPTSALAKEVSTQLKQSLALMPGVNDIYDDNQGGRREIQFMLNDYGRQLGLTQAKLAEVVGGGFGELEVQRLMKDAEEVRLLIRFTQTVRSSLSQLLATPIQVKQGKYVLLEDVVEQNTSRQSDVLYRLNRERVATLYWRQNRSISPPEAVLEGLTEPIAQLMLIYPEVKIRASGEFEELAEVRIGFKKAMLLTLILIFALLAIPLQSYVQPLIIMAVIPFGFAGAIIGHGLMDLPVSILSLFGMMAMTGIVINDSLVLMTRFNQNIEQGMASVAAALEAGRSRLRAIFLTTVTTVCGLLPLMLESSEQAQYLKPAAVSLVFGELLATPITLILLPILLVMCQRDPKGCNNDAGQQAALVFDKGPH
ncbi:efflux RND transporter permease subunit [Shewanella psychromarinicola]|uniref:Efflux RND transporter permease subunit n=1 Tax=Shewanella psychromarinicola TaxID=2487742 RepID=A0A3N4EAA4_9GAMM|nr:efflux RND transporter permease subunit [Shewanella psychromarinicola]AZG35425.1 efflux RND transporter permease subunit [Shewanella psychromarinicola]MCL1084323.1 efflux RND transporter permease subunit [Shewanella psychromarinicola]RPA31160.1 efflux RND transporter permease subunit [Shewanella psychromarinicola]